MHEKAKRLAAPWHEGLGLLCPLAPVLAAPRGEIGGRRGGCRAGAEGRVYYKTFCLGFKLEKTFGSYFPCTAPLRAASCGSLPLPTLSTRFPSPAAAPSQRRCPGSIQPPHWGGRLFPLQTSLAARWDRTAGSEAGGLQPRCPHAPALHNLRAEAMRGCSPLARRTGTPFTPSPRVRGCRMGRGGGRAPCLPGG